MNIEHIINDYFPPKVDLRAVAAESLVVSHDHRKAIAFCERLREEATAWQEDLKLLERTERAFDFLAGQQLIPREEKNFRARVTANYVHSVVERKSGMVTDHIPPFEVVSRSGNAKAANVLRQVTQALWDERNGQEMLSTAVIQSFLTGSAPVCVQWDKQLDFGLGDVRIDVLPPGTVFVDRRLRRAAALQDDAQYVIIGIPRPLVQIYEMYPDTGFLVKPDAELSTYRNSKKPGQGQTSYGQYRRPSRREQPFTSSALPYAMEWRLYFRDHSLNPEMPKRADGTYNYLFPRKRLLVWSKDVMLYDGDPINWDGRFPLELLDSGIETQHPYGESEVDNLASIQSAINVLLSGIVNNSILINDPPFVVDEDALDPEDLQDLRKWGDRPGYVFVKKSGSAVLDRWHPGQMQPVVFQTLQMLASAIETISGITPVTRGEQPGTNITSGVAIDSLMESAQITIRRQKRTIYSFLERLGQLQMNRVMQYFPATRILHMTKDREEATQVLWSREQFYRDIGTNTDDEKLDTKLADAFRDMRFHVRPETPMTQIEMQQAQIISRLADKRRVPKVDELKAYKIDDPEEKLQQAEAELMQEGQMASQLAQQNAVQGMALKAANTPPPVPKQ